MDAPHRAPSGLPAAVLFDKDGTLVVDVPYNGDPNLVRPLPGAAELLGRLRAAGVRLGMVSNQSGVGRGRISGEQLSSVLARTTELLGPFDVVLACPHAEDVGCGCRKPQPGMVVLACHMLRVRPQDVVMVGDIGSDVIAAERAGATGVLVPRPETRPEEVAAAAFVARDLAEVGDWIFAKRGAPAGRPA